MAMFCRCFVNFHTVHLQLNGDRLTCRDWFQLSSCKSITVSSHNQESAPTPTRVRGGARRGNPPRCAPTSCPKERRFSRASSPPILRRKIAISPPSSQCLRRAREWRRMQHTLLGKEQLQAGMHCCSKRHDGQAVTASGFSTGDAAPRGIELQPFNIGTSARQQRGAERASAN